MPLRVNKHLTLFQGMSVLADRLPSAVLPCLTEQYSKRADKHTSPELRVKVGESVSQNV